ncbi:hypothetical protein CAPTEDRAFT_213158 [Capitella teleta]|uniref:Uncharacterized protein n=1 Tax=Capitella teleta TaxID=283909 RepID=R7UR68_CAPTE|nr:hypothetical protein CAPTEDRAFT_213158 [Capitella teleta]|eukprot:ELU08588.1 hypothetical protein CAPTEDRAFT_213158 [Capitella teleta]
MTTREGHIAPLMLSCVSAFNQFHNRKRRCEPTISDIKIRCQSLLLAGHIPLSQQYRFFITTVAQVVCAMQVVDASILSDNNRREHKPSSYQLKTTLFVSCAKMLRNEEDVDGVSVAEWVRMIYDSKFDKYVNPLLEELRKSTEEKQE